MREMQSLRLESAARPLKIGLRAGDNPGIRGEFSLSSPPFEKAREIKMLEASLSQLEQLVNDLVQQNRHLAGQNETLNAELAKAKDENESLVLSLLFLLIHRCINHLQIYDSQK